MLEILENPLTEIDADEPEQVREMIEVKRKIFEMIQFCYYILYCIIVGI